jgi:hypothetical protein
MHKLVLPLAAVALASALTSAGAQTPPTTERITADTPCGVALSAVQEHITAEAASMDETAATRARDWAARAGGAETQEGCFRYVERAAGFAGYDTEFDYGDWETIRTQ